MILCTWILIIQEYKNVTTKLLNAFVLRILVMVVWKFQDTWMKNKKVLWILVQKIVNFEKSDNQKCVRCILDLKP